MAAPGRHPSPELTTDMGGWGATSERAGQSAMFSTNHGDTLPGASRHQRISRETLTRSITIDEVNLLTLDSSKKYSWVKAS